MAETWQSTKARTKRNTKAARQRMIADLGGECVFCGTTFRLEFHHTEPRTWNPAKMNRWTRLANYRRDMERGVIVLACRWCNASIGKPRGPVELAEWVCPRCEWGSPRDGLCDSCLEIESEVA